MSHTIVFGEQKIQEYIGDLSSSTGTPGGGAAAGLAAAQGVALVSMVCQLTTGKEKFAQHQELIDEVLVKCEALSQECLQLMDGDAVAFHKMMAVYKMPKETAEELSARAVARESASKACTLPPLDMMEISVEGLALVKAVLGKSNGNVVSDLGAATTFFASSLEASWLNVVINLKGMADKSFVKEKESQGQELLDSGRQTARELYETVLSWLE